MKKITKTLALVFATCATCMAFGSCGEKPDWMKDVENAITGHKHSYCMDWVVYPTCYIQGVQVYTCDCGDIYTRKTPTGHYFSPDGEEWICYQCDISRSEWYANDVLPYVAAGWWTEEEFTQEVNWYDD